MRANIRRAATSIGGPLLFAGANFLVTLVVQQATPAPVFGLFAFVQLVIASSMALSNGLFGGPLVVVMGNGADCAGVYASFFGVNLIVGAVGALVLALALLPTGTSAQTIGLACILAFAMWVRWFVRSAELAAMRKANAILIDCSYAVIALIGLVTLVLVKNLTLATVLVSQAVAAVISVALIGRAWVCMSKPSAWLPGPFLQAFSRHGIWAVFVAVTTEVVANVHGYVITYLHGASAFAPIAMATLLFRPLGVVLSALVQFERPKMARDLAKGDMGQVERGVRWMRGALAMLWVGNAFAVLIIGAYFPARLLRVGYEQAPVYASICFMAVAVLLKATREPRSAALQAGGDFKKLSYITGLSALITVCCVVAAALVAPSFAPIALSGVLVGEIAYLLLVERRYSAFKIEAAWSSRAA